MRFNARNPIADRMGATADNAATSPAGAKVIATNKAMMDAECNTATTYSHQRSLVRIGKIGIKMRTPKMKRKAEKPIPEAVVPPCEPAAMATFPAAPTIVPAMGKKTAGRKLGRTRQHIGIVLVQGFICFVYPCR